MGYEVGRIHWKTSDGKSSTPVVALIGLLERIL